MKTRTCSLYFFFSRYRKKPRTPGNSSRPSITNATCSGVSLRKGTLTGMPCRRATVSMVFKNRRPLALLNGATAPPRKLRPGSGTIFFKSQSIMSPNPWHPGQAPRGLLKENSRGSGAGMEIPHRLQINSEVNRRRCPSARITTTVPWPSTKALSRESMMRARWLSETVAMRSITTSVVATSTDSSSPTRTRRPPTHTRLNPLPFNQSRGEYVSGISAADSGNPIITGPPVACSNSQWYTSWGESRRISSPHWGQYTRPMRENNSRR